MKLLMCGLILQIIIGKAALDPLTSIQIQNYDGPIYLHAPMTTCNEDSNILHISKDNSHRSSTCNTECNCVSKPSTKYVPINTASESSCSGGTYYVGAYPQCSNVAVYPTQGDTQIYYAMDGTRNPSCPRTLDCGSTEYSTRDDKCLHRCCKCGCKTCSY